MTVKPKVGEFVHYFCPQQLGKVGLSNGYGGRGEGPYAALVTNEIGSGLTLSVFFPGISPLEVVGVEHETAAEVGSAKDKGYWRYPAEAPAPKAEEVPAFDNLTGLEKARAVKAWKREHGQGD
jgi:hypothetical protein